MTKRSTWRITQSSLVWRESAIALALRVLDHPPRLRVQLRSGSRGLCRRGRLHDDLSDHRVNLVRDTKVAVGARQQKGVAKFRARHYVARRERLRPSG